MLFLIVLTQFSSVVQSCLTLWDPIDCSMPGFPVHHQLLEIAQIHIHQVTDAIHSSHPLSSLLLLPSIFSSIMVFFNESVLPIRWPKYWSFSFSINPPMNIQDWFPLGLTGLRDSQESSPTPQFKSINSLVLSLLYGPNLTSMHDSWKNHSFD